MFQIKSIFLGITMLSFAARCALAQDAPQQSTGDNRPEPPARWPISPIMRALDTNGDGVLSAEEIANAPTTLKTLDENKDGKLDQAELRPEFGPGGPNPMGGMPGMGEPSGGMGRSENAMTAEDEVKRYLTLDKNNDGKLTRDEVPARMQGLFTRADSNTDGVITKEELNAMVKTRFSTMQQNGGNGVPGGFGGPPPE